MALTNAPPDDAVICATSEEATKKSGSDIAADRRQLETCFANLKIT